MTVAEILAELESLGKDSIKRVWMKHGAKEPFFGVKVEDLKKIQKRVKTNHALALELFATGNSDAMYLAGLIADDAQMTKKDLERWAKQANWYMLSEYTVAWVAAGSPHGWAMGLKWIDSPTEKIAASGWSTLSSIVMSKPDEELDLAALKKLLARVTKEIHAAQNRVRHCMNHFVIAVGCGVLPLKEAALKAAAKIGKVQVDMGETSCQTPLATDYIAKVEARGTIGKKRKSAKC
jgi:3-methyladenine DNA glycosylase AlkD